MTIELYCASGSLCSQKVKLVLAEKNLEWKNRLLNLLTFENLQPSYIRLNSKGVVPTLLNDGQIVTDSAVIIRYLDDQFPYPRLTPAEPLGQEKMNAWIRLQDQFPLREFMYGNYKGIEGAVLRRSVQIKEKLLPKLIQAHPELKEQYASKLEDVKLWNSRINNANEIASLTQKVELMLDRLATQLNQTEWLCGNRYTLADAVWAAVLNRLDELKFGYLWTNGDRSVIGAYFERLKARSSFKVAIVEDEMPASMLIAGLWKVFLDF